MTINSFLKGISKMSGVQIINHTYIIQCSLAIKLSSLDQLN